MYYVKCLFGFCLVPESDESSDDVSNELSDEKEDKESDEIPMYYRAVWTRSCSLACFIAALQLVYLQEMFAPHSYNLPFQIVSFVLLIILVLS